MVFCSQCGSEMMELTDGSQQCRCGYSIQKPMYAEQVPIRFARCSHCMKIQEFVVIPEYSRIMVFCDEECFEMEKNRKK